MTPQVINLSGDQITTASVSPPNEDKFRMQAGSQKIFFSINNFKPARLSKNWQLIWDMGGPSWVYVRIIFNQKVQWCTEVDFTVSGIVTCTAQPLHAHLIRSCSLYLWIFTCSTSSLKYSLQTCACFNLVQVWPHKSNLFTPTYFIICKYQEVIL